VKINQSLDNKNLKLTNILDNVEQGILTFKENLIIHSEYSLICKKIFGECIKDKKLSSIIYSKDKNMQLFVDDLLVKIFEIDKTQQEIYLTLLPNEIVINNRFISLDYKIVKDESNEDTIMTIITDVTEKKILEKQRDKEHDTLKMVVKTILNRDDFRELVFEFEDFVSQRFDNLPKEKYEEILREIHTFKGSFSQYEMVNLISKLDELESKLYEKNDLFHVKDIDNRKLRSWLMEDLGIIEAYAGEDFIKDEEFCYIKKEKLVEIEKKVAQTLSSKEARVILPLIKSLRYKSLKELLKTYPDYVVKLSERMGKNVAPFNITGDDIMIDSNYYQDVLKSLVHIFRNSVDHGIESDDERIENNKEEMANIKCNIVDLSNSFSIEISDNGRGIDLKALENKVINEGLFTEEEFNELEFKEKLQLIYRHGITTKEKATYVSGRGVGMAAVKQIVEDCNGNIEVESLENKGTKFIITLPKLEEKEVVIVTAENFMEEVMKTSKNIILSQTSMEFEEKTVEIKDRVTLNKITALVSLKGDFNSIMMVSVNEKMAKEFVKGFMIDNIEESVILEYVEDVLGEISNTILGSTFGKFENTNSKFYMGLPAVLSNSDGYVKHAQSEILSFSLKRDDYEFGIHMFLVNDEVNGIYKMEDIIDG
jgi:CheY-specific phosphatase CheX/signal transduction histidine kinase